MLDGDSTDLPGAGGWALGNGLAALRPFWTSNELAFLPAVGATGAGRSHFQAQQVLERGGSAGTTGWLDRTLTALGPGTTFRAVATGYAEPVSMGGIERKLAMNSLQNFVFPGWDGVRPQSIAALTTLYRDDTSVLGQDVPTTLAALATAEKVRTSIPSGVQNGAVYPQGDFASSLKDLATTLRAEVGLQVATVDVGGWDTHTNETGDIDGLLTDAAHSIAAFFTDLGATRRKRVTMVVLTEFGRRVAMNASNGTDHGTGGVMMVLGGGLAMSKVAGQWIKVDRDHLSQGDIPLVNSSYAALYEVVSKRLGISNKLSSIFPGYTGAYTPPGIIA